MRPQYLRHKLPWRARHWFGSDNEPLTYEACAVNEWMTCVAKRIYDVSDFEPDVARTRPVDGRGDRRYKQQRHQ